MPFDLAAVLCGHDPSTPTGAENARHDHRVWDLVGGAGAPGSTPGGVGAAPNGPVVRGEGAGFPQARDLADREPLPCCGSTEQDPITEVPVHDHTCKAGARLAIERARRALRGEG